MVTHPSSGSALITGASAGIGAIYADRLAQRGYELILVARIEHLLRTDASTTMLVNNAGIGATAPLLASDIETIASMIDLNVTALARPTCAAAPGFVARNGGTIINIASIVGIAPELLNGVYGGSKAFVRAFSQSLNHQLADQHMRIQAVVPGAIATDFRESAGTPLEHWPGERVMPAEDLVDAALAGLDQGELSPRCRKLPTGMPTRRRARNSCRTCRDSCPPRVTAPATRQSDCSAAIKRPFGSRQKARTASRRMK